MYEKLRIQNFRCFEDLTVEGLTRVNLVVGSNGAGKTALLEALFAATGARTRDPLGALCHLRDFPRSPGTGRLHEDLVNSLFLGSDSTLTATVTAEDTSGSDSVELDVPARPSRALARLSWELAGGGSVEAVYDAQTGNFVGNFSDPRELPTSYPVFVGTRAVYGHETEAGLFSRAVRDGNKAHVVRALQVIAPAAESLELLEFAGETAVHAALRAGTFLPLGLLSEGLQRLASLVLRLSEASNSVLLADEIDTGLHYSVLTDMWRVVASAAVDVDCQLFATTHSHECMVAAYEAFQDSPDDLSVHRLERVGDKIECVSFGHETLGLALERRMEVR